MSQKILFITPSLAKGGAETQLLKVARCFRQQGHDIFIIALWSYNNFDVNFQKEGIGVLFLNKWRTLLLANLKLIYQTIKRYNPNTTIAFTFSSIIIGRLFKPFFKYKLVSSIRTSVISRKWYALFRITASFDDLVVYNSHSSKVIFENSRIVKREGVVINNAIQIPLSEGCDGQAVAVSRIKPFVWCTLAHFRSEKDYPTLFKAIAKLKNNNFRVNVIGHTNDLSWPFKMIKDLGIENKVSILGFQHDVRPYLNEADAFVLSTRWEGSPNSVLEAMAHGKPVVATAVPGIINIINESKAGHLFRKGNEDDLAEKMLGMMLMNNDERVALGIKARNYVQISYAEDVVMKQWLSLIKDPRLFESSI